MKFNLIVPVLVVLLLLNKGCKKNSASNTPEAINIVYHSSCNIASINWLADNETILLNDFCNGTLKKINSITKTVQLYNIDKEHFLQKVFYSEQLPNYAFYIALTKNATGIFPPPLKLFSLDLTTGNYALIRDGITQLPTSGGYTMGNKHLAIQSGTELLVIDLEHGTTQSLPIPAKLQAFSPDDTKLLFYPTLQGAFSNAIIYDFACNCAQSLAVSGSSTGTPIWRSQGLYEFGTGTTGLYFLNLGSGALIKSFPDFVAGPWIAQKGSLAIIFAKAPTFATDQKGLLLSFDFTTGQTKEIATSIYRPYSTFIYGIYLAAISPNQKKVAYVENADDLKVHILQP